MIIRRPQNELAFIDAGEPLMTVEVDLDSIPSHYHYTCDELVVLALRPFAKKDLRFRATIFVKEMGSMTFRERTNSAFFGVAGPGEGALLESIRKIFKRIPDVRARISDSIKFDNWSRHFHVQDGLIWLPDDATTWAANDGGVDQTLDDQPEAGSLEAYEDAESPAVYQPQPNTKEQTPSRFRAARADASVSSIRAQIEKVFGLPEGAVSLCGPDKKPLRGNATIGTLRKRWD